MSYNKKAYIMADKELNTEEQRANRTLLITMAVVLAAVAVAAIVGFLFLKPPKEIITGQVEATTVRVSGKLPGRVMEFYVSEGDTVQTGDTLVRIHSSLAEAKLMQAEAMMEAANAQNEKADAGTRKQIIQSANDLWQQANAALTVTKKTYDRMESLFAQGVVSEQKRDEALAAYQSAKAAEDAAHNQYLLAVEGAQKEDKASASAMVTVARGGVKEVESLLEDEYLLAPCGGSVDEIYPEAGELVSTGTPIMKLLRTDGPDAWWITFNVREQLLGSLAMGKEIEVEVPALGEKMVKAKIYYVKDMGNYAVWRSTKATGEWDSRTFQIKARLSEQLPGLRPGMSVIYRK